MDFQIQRLLQERRLEEYAATDDELVGFLRKAARGIGDAHAKISEEGAFLRAYEGAFLSATAAILNTGYRLRGSAEGHHNDLVLVLRHLGAPDLAALGNRWERLKRLRHRSMYDGETQPSTNDVAEMRAVADELFATVRYAIFVSRPSVRERLPTSPVPKLGRSDP